MRLLILLVCLTNPFLMLAQNNNASIEQPKYDTMYVDTEIRSKNSFYFCNKLYQIPQDCISGKESSCCSFDTHLNNRSTKIQFGTLNCYGNSSIMWQYYESLSIAEWNIENQINSFQKQNLSLSKIKFNLKIDNQNAVGYKISSVSHNLESNNFIIFYGNINSQAASATLYTYKNGKSVAVNSSKELSPFFQTIFSF
jgi:hypothetical protein